MYNISCAKKRVFGFVGQIRPQRSTTKGTRRVGRTGVIATPTRFEVRARFQIGVSLSSLAAPPLHGLSITFPLCSDWRAESYQWPLQVAHSCALRCRPPRKSELLRPERRAISTKAPFLCSAATLHVSNMMRQPRLAFPPATCRKLRPTQNNGGESSIRGTTNCCDPAHRSSSSAEWNGEASNPKEKS
jgi:hypothetical protein